jgi:hypothetical protein
VPLSQQALTIIAVETRGGRRAARLPGSGRQRLQQPGNCKKRLDVKSGVTDWTLHDLRRTLPTKLQVLGVRLEVIEAVLNHTSGPRAGIVGIYQRYTFDDEKLEAMQRWVDRLDEIIADRKPAGNVVPIRA